MSIEAMKQALEALEYYRSFEDTQPTPASEAMPLLRQAIEQAEKRHWEYLPEDQIQWLVSLLISRLKEKRPITEERVAEALYGAVYLASLHSQKLNENNVI